MSKQTYISAKEAQAMFMEAFLINPIKAEEALRQYKDILGSTYFNSNE